MRVNLGFSEAFDEFRDIAFGAWRYRWKGVALTWMLCLSGWFFVMSLPNIYEASSRVYLDTDSTLKGLLERDVVIKDVLAEASIMVESVTSRPSLQRVATVTGLLVGNPSDIEVQKVVGRLQEDLEVSLDIAQVLEVKYEHETSDIALAVVSQLIDAFIEGLLGANRTDSDSAEDFLLETLEKYEKQLTLAEKKLADFKKENIGQMPGAGGDYFTRLQKEQEVLDNVNFKLRLARQRHSELERQLEGEAPVFGLMAPTEDTAVLETAVGRQIAEYERQLGELRMQYTDSHPDIVRINGILEDLQNQQREQQASLPVSQEGTLDENPVYQSMRIQLSSVELEMIEIEAERVQHMKMVNDLRNKVDVIPEVEANLTRLNRDYEVNKAQYDALLQRLETARLTEAAEQSKNEFDFQIIDPPTVSSAPVGPPRVLFMTAVLVLSIGAGAALAVFLSFTRPVFYSTRGLEQHFRLPVLGGLRYIATEADYSAKRRKAMVFTTCFASILCVYVLAVSFNQASSEFVNGLLLIIGTLT